MIYSTRKLVAVVALALAVGCGAEGDMLGMPGMGTDASLAIDGGGTGGALGTGGGAGGNTPGADAQVMGSGGAAGSMTGSGGATGGASGGAAGAASGGISGTTGGAPGSGGVSGAGGAPAVTYNYCPQYPEFQRTKPGYLNKDLTWTSRYKDGYACAICTQGKAAPKQVVGCLVKYDVVLDGPEPILCVMSQVECCFKKADSSCDRDTDCCSPLKCQDNGPGKNKTCR